ncbi:hypothetical protein [uncultured Draconibacterium sp.]|uniref:hypothetical protein n=1 Tax=uncultured Draconibacterium sp. TaxID=1573823 RepID=UPI0037486E3F
MLLKKTKDLQEKIDKIKAENDFWGQLKEQIEKSLTIEEITYLLNIDIEDLKKLTGNFKVYNSKDKFLPSEKRKLLETLEKEFYRIFPLETKKKKGKIRKSFQEYNQRISNTIRENLEQIDKLESVSFESHLLFFEKHKTQELKRLNDEIDSLKRVLSNNKKAKKDACDYSKNQAARIIYTPSGGKIK